MTIHFEIKLIKEERMDKKQISKRYLSLFLALIMLIGTLPMNIFAQEPTTGTCTADPNKVSSSNIVKDEDKKEKTKKMV